MKILLMSDTHLGFAQGTIREEDAFLSFEEGIEKALEADLILLGGDIFDSRVPTAETFSRMMEILLKTKQRESTVTLAETRNKKIKNQVSGIPVVAIHGNHERRVRGLVNPIEALERGGFLIHLHCNGVVFEKNGEKVAVQGMSAVPEQYAVSALEEWNPQPLEGAYNIFLFHQNLEGFVRAERTFPKASLPQGFDLSICGDIHESHQSKDGKLLLPGSTVATQITKDSCNLRVYWEIDTQKRQLLSHPFKNQRKIYYEEFEKKEEAETFIQKVLQEPHPLQPIIKIKTPLPPEEITARFGKEAILKIVQEKEIPTLSLEEQKLSVQQSGKQLLEKNLKQLNLDPKLFEAVFELLVNKKQEEALNLLKEKK